MQLIAAQAAEVLGDDDPNLAVLHVRDHPLEVRAVEVGPGITVIHIEAGIGEMVVDSILLQGFLLILNAIGFALQTVILAETAVQGGFLHLV